MDVLANAEKLPPATIRLLVVVALAVALVAGLLQWGRYAPLRQVDSFFYDSFVSLGTHGRVASPVALVSIDDNSLSEVGQWPWPRYKLAQLLTAIQIGNPAVIGADIIFPEQDRTALSVLQQSYRNDFGLDIRLDNIPQPLHDNDAYLGAVMADAGVVGAINMLFEQFNKAPVHISEPSGIRLEGETGRLKLVSAPGILLNTFRIQSQLKYSGFINIQPDQDGVVRRIPLLLRYHDRVYPHLLLAGLMRLANTDTVTVLHDAFGPMLRVGNHVIPVNEDGSMLLRFPGTPGTIHMISALDVLRNTAPAQALAGKPVFVGSAAAVLHDFVNTPTDSQFPGLGLYGVGLGNIIDNDYIREPAWSGMASLLLSLFCGGAIAALFVWSTRPVILLLGSMCVLLLVVGASGMLALASGVYLSPAAGTMATLASLTLLSLGRFAIEKRRAFVWLNKINDTQRMVIESMTTVAETRDPETGGHIKRTQNYVRALAGYLAREGRYPELLTPEYISLLYLSAPLHDIGKVGVRDSILLKPGKLDEDEFELMKQHARYGAEIIANASKGLEGDNFLRIAAEIAGCHHEKWDGTGYPNGLAGEAIPLSARLMAVADVYDALISKRCYKPSFPHDVATRILLEKRGNDLDPVVVDAFFAIEEEIIGIAREFADERVPEPTTKQFI